MSLTPPIAYIAETASCTFLLDADGICRRVVPVDSGRRASSSRRDAASAARCLGAQYVASLDPNVSGMLADMPRVGAAMLFARVDERGRVSLVRTGTVTQFGRHHEEVEEDPFSAGEEVTSRSVETSAPALPPRMRGPELTSLEHDPYDDESADEHTRPVETYDPGRASGRYLPHDLELEDHDETVDDDLQRTAEYEARPPRRLDDGEPASSPATLRGAPALPPVAARGRGNR